MMALKTVLYLAGIVTIVSYVILLYRTVNKLYFDHYGD